MRNFFWLMLVAAAGCQGGTAPSTGTLTPKADDGYLPFNGTVRLANSEAEFGQLDGAKLRFEPAAGASVQGVAVITDGGTFAAATRADGQLRAGLPPGEYRVWIDAGDAVVRGVPAKYLRKGTTKWTVSVPAALPLKLELDPK